MLEHFIEVVYALHGKPWAAPVFVLTYGLVCLTGPITPFPVAGGVLFGFWMGVLWSLMAQVLGASAAFYLGRRFGQRFVSRRLGNSYARFESIVSREGFRALLLMRLLGFPPFVALNYLGGMSGVSWLTYVYSTALGVIPWTMMMTYLSRLLWTSLVAEGWRGFHRSLIFHWKEFAAIGVFAASMLLIQWWLMRRQKRGDQLEGLKE